MRTTYQQHARIMRKIINHDSGGNRTIVCAWDECDRPGYQLYRTIYCQHPQNMSCQDAHDMLAVMHGQSAHYIMVFCSEQHRGFFRNNEGRNAKEGYAAGKQMFGNLPAGMRGRLG